MNLFNLSSLKTERIELFFFLMSKMSLIAKSINLTIIVAIIFFLIIDIILIHLKQQLIKCVLKTYGMT